MLVEHWGYRVSCRTCHWMSRQNWQRTAQHARGCAPDVGAGRIRHIHCPALWLQHAVARRQIAITQRAGKDLAPDVGTKAGIPEDTMWRLLGMFGLAKGEGRAKQALDMAGRQAKAGGHGYVTFARPILNDAHSSHALTTKPCSDCVGCHFVIIAVLPQRSACKTANATFSIARASSESHVCFACNSRLFVLFLEVVSNGRKPALL